MSDAAKRRRSFSMGYLTALCGPVIAMPEREPVAYLYNGVRLPGLPESQYKYAAIDVQGSDYWLGFFDSPLHTRADGGKCEFSQATQTVAYLLSGQEWVKQMDNVTFTDWPIPFWSNHDILNEDGTVFLAGSEPVPVYE